MCCGDSDDRAESFANTFHALLPSQATPNHLQKIVGLLVPASAPLPVSMMVRPGAPCVFRQLRLMRREVVGTGQNGEKRFRWATVYDDTARCDFYLQDPRDPGAPPPADSGIFVSGADANFTLDAEDGVNESTTTLRAQALGSLPLPPHVKAMLSQGPAAPAGTGVVGTFVNALSQMQSFGTNELYSLYEGCVFANEISSFLGAVVDVPYLEYLKNVSAQHQDEAAYTGVEPEGEEMTEMKEAVGPSAMVRVLCGIDEDALANDIRREYGFSKAAAAYFESTFTKKKILCWGSRFGGDVMGAQDAERDDQRRASTQIMTIDIDYQSYVKQGPIFRSAPCGCYGAERSCCPCCLCMKNAFCIAKCSNDTFCMCTFIVWLNTLPCTLVCPHRRVGQTNVFESYCSSRCLSDCFPRVKVLKNGRMSARFVDRYDKDELPDDVLYSTLCRSLCRLIGC